jgi:hypothetical protein
MAPLEIAAETRSHIVKDQYPYLAAAGEPMMRERSSGNLRPIAPPAPLTDVFT